MKLYTIKINNQKEARYDLIRFCNENNISIWLTWVEEDMFVDILFADLLVPEECQKRLENRYIKAIVNIENYKL